MIRRLSSHRGHRGHGGFLQRTASILSVSSVVSVANLLLALILLWPTSAFGAAVGTTAGTSITNGAFSAGDTVPQTAGKLSVAYKISSNLPDSRYVGFNSSGVSATVDTGYDISNIGTPANKTDNIGDTVSYAYGITNLSNATIRIYFDSTYHPVGQSDSGPGSAASTNWDIGGSYKVYYDGDNDGLWANGDTQITSIELPSGGNETVVLVVVIPTDANDGETSTAFIHVTDRAPRNLPTLSTTGDGWQDSLPIATNDSRDTQYDTTVTTVSGPNIIISKTITELSGSNSRPGDTLIIAITFDNDGTDSARGADILDAVPDNTRFLRNSADSVELPNQWSFNTVNGYSDTAYRVYYDTDAAGSQYDFKDTFTAFGSDNATARLISVIKWSLNQTIGATTGDATGSVNFDQTKNDNGRVYFRVVIR